jgi:hypothetical protein
MVFSTGHSNQRWPRQPRAFLAWSERQNASFAERDVARIHVHQEHAETLEGPEDSLHFLPLGTELRLFLRAPIGEYLLGKVGRLIEIGAGKIENEGARHDGHFDDPEFVVVTQHFGNGATANVRNLALDQPQIHVAFAAIGALSLMDFDGRSVFFALAFEGKYVTMNSRSEGIAKNQTICLAVFLRAAKKLRWIAHECTADKSFGPLRGRADSLVRERQRHAGGAARPEVPDPENSRRSSSLRRRNRHVNRRPREPLGGAFAQWHSRGGAENRDFGSLTATRTDAHFNSATALKPWRVVGRTIPQLTESSLQFGHAVKAVEDLLKIRAPLLT